MRDHHVLFFVLLQGVPYRGLRDVFSRLVEEGKALGVGGAPHATSLSESAGSGEVNANRHASAESANPPKSPPPRNGPRVGGWRGVAKVFFSGVEPRVMWISIGGFVFFGAYEQAKSLLSLL